MSLVSILALWLLIGLGTFAVELFIDQRSPMPLREPWWFWAITLAACLVAGPIGLLYQTAVLIKVTTKSK